MLKFLVEKISSYYLSILLACPTAILSVLSVRFHKEAEALVGTLNSTQTTLILLLLAMVSLELLSLSIYLATWFKWDEPTGTWLSRLSKLRYCPKCKASKIVTPLKNEVTGWRCMNCQHFFHDPARANIESPKKKVLKNQRI